MRLPASTLGAQDCYPLQSEGGYTGDIHASVLKALKDWEAKRFPNGQGFKYGKTGFFRPAPKQSATRAEISWNAAPEVKRAPSPRKKTERTERQKISNKEKMRLRRERETPEQRAKRLAERRAWYAALRGDKYKAQRPKQTPEQRKQSIREAKARYNARVKAGLVTKKTAVKRQLTPEQLAAKAARQRKYHADYRKSLTGSSQA